MTINLVWDILIPILVSIFCGVFSSSLWWHITRNIGFPSLDVDKNITAESNGNRIIKIKNTHKKYEAFDIICYAEYMFTYKGHLIKSSLHPRMINSIKALDAAEVSVKFPIKEITNKDGSKELVSEAFYESTDGKLYVKIVYQNKYGVRHFIPHTFVVEREIEKLSEENSDYKY